MPSYSSRLSTMVALFLALAILVLGALPAGAQSSPSRHFPQTNQSVQGEFLKFFDRRGGVALFGYPITGEIMEDGVIVQYFQRARFEWHPDNPPAYRVQLGLLGQEIYGHADPPVQPLPATARRRARYFSETGHNVTNVFLDFWNRNGGLDAFGYPLGEAFNRDGVTYQWFQRARFEYRNGRVELGLIGSELRSGEVTALAAPLPAETVRRRQFAETGQTVQGAFLEYWEKNGGAARFGYPISGEFNEGGKQVQYFEYARFEWHPANPPGFQVLLGLVGQELYGPSAPGAENFAPPWNANFEYFPQTGHTVSHAFLRYFRENGGVEIFGYPLNEATEEGGAIIQWFQRRKLRYANGRVEEEALGRARFNPDTEGRFQPQQLFLLFLQGNGAVGAKVGAGLEDAKNPTVAYQPFEGGQMLWRSDTNQIYVLYQDNSWQVYDNPWRPGKAAGSGLTPPAGRQEPLLGFGEVWRSIGGPGSKLGWATAPQADGRGTAQRFQFGTLLYSPADNRIYVLYAGEGWFNFENQWPQFAPKQ